ncbi:MAG: sodium-dependent transporter [Myxococcota bacterium]
MEQQARETWSSRLGFVLAASGSAIGLGALWKLPYTMGQNGGGAFIALFLVLNIVVGTPLFAAELLLGRASRRGTIGAFARFAPEGSAWNLGGWLAAAAALLILSWYCVVAGWGMHCIFMALTNGLDGKSPRQVAALFDLFRVSPELNVLFQGLFLTCTAAIVAGGLSRGIERASRVMTSGLFVMLLGLTLYGATLPGFGQAVRYVFLPDWAALTPRAMLQALGLALFTLSLGYGPIITYGSYMKSREDIPKLSLIVAMANVVAAVLIATAVFPLIFSFGFAPRMGEGLIFQTLPFVFEQLRGGMLLSVTFFTLLLFAALTSSVSFLEVLVANLMDLLQWPRRRGVVMAGSAAFVLGLPTALGESGVMFASWSRIYGTSFLATCNVLGDWMIALAALITTLFVGWRLPARARREEFCSGAGRSRKLYQTWLWCVRLVIPTSIILIVLQRAGLLHASLTSLS